MDIHPQQHQQGQQPQSVEPTEPVGRQQIQKADEQRKRECLRANIPVGEGNWQRDDEQRDAQAQPPTAPNAQPQQQPIGKQQRRSVNQQQQWHATCLIHGEQRNLRKPGLIEEWRAVAGIRKTVGLWNRATRQRLSPGGNMEPQIVGRHRCDKWAEQNQHDRCCDPNMVECGAALCGKSVRHKAVSSAIDSIDVNYVGM